jgi:hypothetical protein
MATSPPALDPGAAGWAVAAAADTPLDVDVGEHGDQDPAGAGTDQVVPQVFWSLRSNFNGTALNPREVNEWVSRQMVQASIRSNRPVAMLSGIDEPGIEPTPVTADRLGGFVDTVTGAVAIGGGHCDDATTPPHLWTNLTRLNTL